MLKKADMKPGAIVEVNPVIKTGLPKSMFGDSSMSGSDDRLEFLSVRKSFMLGEGGWNVSSGERLEIVEPPKRRDSINGIKVKILSNGESGMVYWCELRASCKLIETPE
tara:strand:- start:170 stop:496 length:327 start_codon:yes stop_codon:yes gene_type:complete